MLCFALIHTYKLGRETFLSSLLTFLVIGEKGLDIYTYHVTFGSKEGERERERGKEKDGKRERNAGYP